jgi:hypothetical protein
MTTLIETKTQKATLRLRQVPNGNFTVEKWDQADQSWDCLATSQEYYVAMHEFFDEVIATAPKPSTT